MCIRDSLCSDANNVLACPPFPSRSGRSIFSPRRHPRTKLTIFPNHIMIDQSFSFLLCLQANTFSFKILSLPPGRKRVKSSKFDLIDYLIQSRSTVVPSFAHAVCCALFLLRTTLHLLRHPLILLPLCLAVLLVFNRVQPLPPSTFLQFRISALLLPIVLLDDGINPFNPRENQKAG